MLHFSCRIKKKQSQLNLLSPCAYPVWNYFGAWSSGKVRGSNPGYILRNKCYYSFRLLTLFWSRWCVDHDVKWKRQRKSPIFAMAVMFVSTFTLYVFKYGTFEFVMNLGRTLYYTGRLWVLGEYLQVLFQTNQSIICVKFTKISPL